MSDEINDELSQKYKAEFRVVCVSRDIRRFGGLKQLYTYIFIVVEPL